MFFTEIFFQGVDLAKSLHLFLCETQKGTKIHSMIFAKIFFHFIDRAG